VPARNRSIQQPDLFTAGLRISGDFDDNALYDNTNRRSRTFTRMEPRLTCNFSQPRVQWKVDYRPGFSWNYGLSNYGYVSHLLETNLDYSLTKRLRIAQRVSFLETRDPLDRLRDSRLTEAALTTERSDAFIAPSARTTSGQAAMELSYASGPHSTVGASGSFSRVKYETLASLGFQGPAELEDGRSIAGRAFYSHQLTHSQWTGFEYNLQRLSSRAAQSRYLVQSWLYVQKLAFASNKTLSILAGPERSAMLRSSFLQPQRSSWGWAGMANYNWTGNTISLLAGLSHRLSDGGLLGPVRLSGGNAEVRQKFSAKWTADFLAAFSRSRTISIVPSSFSYVSAGAGITRVVNESLSIEIRYWRIHQSTSSARAAAYLADRNRLSVALTYDLKNPLGR
jgi:hypothetical protein